MVAEVEVHQTPLEIFPSWSRHQCDSGDAEVDGRTELYRIIASAAASSSFPPYQSGIRLAPGEGSRLFDRQAVIINSNVIRRSRRYTEPDSCPSSCSTTVREEGTRKTGVQESRSPGESLGIDLVKPRGGGTGGGGARGEGARAGGGGDEKEEESHAASYISMILQDAAQNMLSGQVTTTKIPSSEAVKRVRAVHDVDGPGTGILSSKKRRLRLGLITSRLSQPYSLPATHILNRESNDDAPVLSQFLKFAANGAKKAGHQAHLVRKAAILNRIRITVRQTAVSRGHLVVANLAARDNVLSHGLQVVTTAASTGARYPGPPPRPDQQMPPAWRPHTTSFQATSSNIAFSDRLISEPVPAVTGPEQVPANFRSPELPKCDCPEEHCHFQEPLPRPPSVVPIAGPLSSSGGGGNGMADDDDEIAFPSPDLDTRYADLSDDDMGDIYADFGVIFGSGARPSESSASGSDLVGDEHFYEEYLDELDGIPWAA
ncbi:hypothetical protein F4778DRAFT_484959 [Xylariomycetidae sp. FL2044]|nr:hypothetical protein F4778DRAFT_484959 [Xylariomycetidae sp. FL2044]